MHNLNLMHRDLKLDNILLNDKGEIKLCDFGWSCKKSKLNPRKSLCGTEGYVAPEVYRGED
jgi:serine/threonine protein kinase